MNNTAVIYKSKYGSTKKYAEWIAKDLDADLFEGSKVNVNQLSKYDTIIFGGGLYADGILGVDIITKNYESIKNKNIIIYTVGLGSTNDKEEFNRVIDKNFRPEMIKKIQFYHFQGGIDYGKLSLKHKMMMYMFYKFIAKKKVDELSADAKMIVATYGKNVDYTDKASIDPLVGYARGVAS